MSKQECPVCGGEFYHMVDCVLNEPGSLIGSGRDERNPGSLQSMFGEKEENAACEIERLRKQLERARSALTECEDYFDQRADADLEPGALGYTGNEEMKLLVEVREALAKLPKSA